MEVQASEPASMRGKNYHRWTAEQDQTLKDDWGKYSCAIIGEKLNCSKKSILARARRLKLPFLGRRNPFLAKKLGIHADWSAEHTEFLKTMWGVLSCSLIAAHVGRTRNAVIGKSQRLGLTKLPKYDAKRTTQAKKARPKARKPPRTRIIVPDAPPIIDTLIPFDQRKTLLELGPRDCRWPVGHPGEESFFFCGGATFAGQSYCAAHYRRAHTYTAEPRRKDRNTFSFGRAA